MVGIANQRRTISLLVGALALIAASFVVARWRPLFSGFEFGLVIELVSCVAAIVLASVVVMNNLPRWRASNRILRARTAVVTTIVCSAILLDLVAATYDLFRP
jgi:hypothetical protein